MRGSTASTRPPPGLHSPVGAAVFLERRGSGTLTGGGLLPYSFFSSRPASVEVSKAFHAWFSEVFPTSVIGPRPVVLRDMLITATRTFGIAGNRATFFELLAPGCIMVEFWARDHSSHACMFGPVANVPISVDVW